MIKNADVGDEKFYPVIERGDHNKPLQGSLVNNHYFNGNIWNSRRIPSFSTQDLMRYVIWWVLITAVSNLSRWWQLKYFLVFIPIPREMIQFGLIWMFPKKGVSLNHPLENRVFHYFHHPFWGFSPYFWFNTHIFQLSWWDNHQPVDPQGAAKLSGSLCDAARWSSTFGLHPKRGAEFFGEEFRKGKEMVVSGSLNRW